MGVWFALVVCWRLGVSLVCLLWLSGRGLLGLLGLFVDLWVCLGYFCVLLIVFFCLGGCLCFWLLFVLDLSDLPFCCLILIAEEFVCLVLRTDECYRGLVCCFGIWVFVCLWGSGCFEL